MTDREHEEWRDVPGYPRYQVSNLGRVKSLKSKTERILKPGYVRGYPSVGLSHYNGAKTLTVHRLVWLAFNGEIPKHLQVNHKDGNRANAALSNLELLTAKENIQHAYRLFGRKMPVNRKPYPVSEEDLAAANRMRAWLNEVNANDPWRRLNETDLEELEREVLGFSFSDPRPARSTTESDGTS